MRQEEILATQNEELTALEAIYGDCIRLEDNPRRCEVHIPEIYVSPKLVLIFELTMEYPIRQPPLIRVLAPHLQKEQTQWMCEQMLNLYQIGSPVLFECIEWVREQEDLYLKQCQGPQEKIDPAAHEQDEAQHQLVQSISEKIVHGVSLTEKRSTFQAHLCQVHSIEDVDLMMEALQLNSKIRHATHNILAYRIFNPTTNAFIQDFDDDGETAAGGRLLHLLQVEFHLFSYLEISCFYR
eukprot:g7011.t1